jgi:hypothetical protein
MGDGSKKWIEGRLSARICWRWSAEEPVAICLRKQVNDSLCSCFPHADPQLGPPHFMAAAAPFSIVGNDTSVNQTVSQPAGGAANQDIATLLGHAPRRHRTVHRC